MIGLNGALVSLLCAAYFALIVSALWDDRPAQEPDRRSNVQMVATNVMSSRTEAARVRRVDRTIGGVVLDLRRRERPAHGGRRRPVCARPPARALRAPSRR